MLLLVASSEASEALPECDLTESHLPCQINITSRWRIENDIQLDYVDISCYTRQHWPLDGTCMNIDPGVTVVWNHVMLYGENVEQCISMSRNSTLIADGLTAVKCGKNSNYEGGFVRGFYSKVSLLNSEIHNSQSEKGGAICMYGGTLVIDKTDIVASSAKDRARRCYLFVHEI